MQDWDRLVGNLNDEQDKFVCVLEKSGKYSTRSMYKRLNFREVTNRRMKKM